MKLKEKLQHYISLAHYSILRLFFKANYFTDPLFWNKQLGNKYAQYFASLCADVNERAPLSLLKQIRWPRLKRLILLAHENVSLYQELYDQNRITPDNINSEKDLKLLPIVNKNDFRRYSPKDGFIAKNISPQRKRAGFTSGSTGQPFQYVRDNAEITEKTVLRNRFWKWTGADINAPKIFCSPESARNVCPNLIFLHPHFIRTRKKEYIKTIKTSGAKLLFGAAMTTFDLLWMLHKEKEQDIFFEKAILGGHTVTPGIRSFLLKNFGCTTFEFYGAGEVGIVAFECEMHRGLHIHEENIIVEIVNAYGLPVPDGIPGRIILTPLYNEVMPFIRYDIGDLGIMLPQICACGRTLRRLIVEGRTDECLLLGKNGESIAPSVLRDILDPYFPYFHRYQVIQDSIESFVINTVPTDIYDEEISRDIIKKIHQSIGYPAQISIHCVSEIKPLPSGKFQYFISDLWKKTFPSHMLDPKNFEERIHEAQ